MLRRAPLVLLLALVSLAEGFGSAEPAASETRAHAPFYLGHEDSRLCPSPICGGVWVRLANRRTTACGDGLRRRECYVATIDVSRVSVPASLRPRLAGLVESGQALAKGRLVHGRVAGFPELATLVVFGVWPASSDPSEPRGRFWLLRDNGIRCVTTPCFSTDASLLNSPRRTTISSLDLSSLRISQAERHRAREAIAAGTLIVAGWIAADPDAGPAGSGRVLVASRLYVRAGR